MFLPALQVLHQLWINEGYTSPAFLAAAHATYPSAAVDTEMLILQEVGAGLNYLHPHLPDHHDFDVSEPI